MKDKLLQIRVDESLLSQITYLQRINGFKSVSETIRKIVEKEYRKETAEWFCKECEHHLPPLTGVVDGEVKELTSIRCPLMSSGFTQPNGWCYHFRQNGKDLFTDKEGYLLN